MKVLIACEFSGAVRDAFIRQRHDAWSCDLLPTTAPGPHIMDDVRNVLDFSWDLMIAHPPCTHLAVSGAAWFENKTLEQKQALVFVRQLMDAPIPHICIENPVSVISTRIRRPDQIIQPYQFGHAELKTTCLWLKQLPRLEHTSNLKTATYAKPPNERNPKHYLPPSPDRWALRSMTYPGIAEAMASQWSDLSKASYQLDMFEGVG